MGLWHTRLRVDPLPALLGAGDVALEYWVRRDLLEGDAGPVARLWQLPEPRKIFKKQQPDGSWLFHGKDKSSRDRRLVETWRQFRILVDKYGFDRTDPLTAKAAEFVFSCQSEAGDLRGFIANQYATYYTGALLSLLVRAGYENDPRVEKGLRWLLSMRQDDGGWSVPILTHHFDGATMYRLTSRYEEPVEPVRSQPFSHGATGMVLRAFAAHSSYRTSEAARTAAILLKSRFFQPDSYTSYRAASYWVRFQYPFWWNNLVAALDSISLIDPTMDSQMEKALGWLIDHQEADGLWKATYVAGKEVDSAQTRETRPWVSLAICRVLARLS